MWPEDAHRRGFALANASAASAKSPEIERACPFSTQYQKVTVCERSEVSSASKLADLTSSLSKLEKEDLFPRIFSTNRCCASNTFPLPRCLARRTNARPLSIS